MISQNIIDDVLSRANIVDVVSARYDIKKAGKNYHARCPFHDEKTPSFTVAEHKQFYYCFGCGAQGNAIGFLMEYERMTFPEAVKSLAAQYGVQIDDNNHVAVAPRQVVEQYETDKIVIAIYNADKAAGKSISLEDHRRNKLAVARVEGVKNKYNMGDL